MQGPFGIHTCVLNAFLQEERGSPSFRAFLRIFLERQGSAFSASSRSRSSMSSRMSSSRSSFSRSSLSSRSSASSRSSTGSSLSSRSSTGSSISSMSSASSLSRSSMSSASSQSIVSVNIQNFRFRPSLLTVRRGTTVRWTNWDSAPHTATGADGRGPQSPLLSFGQSYSYAFNDLGTFPYFCELHPYMYGTVRVTE